MTSRPVSPNPWLRHALGFAVLGLIAGLITWDAVARSRHIVEVSRTYGVAVDAPAVVPDSPTGYAQARRSMVLPSGASDTYHWIMQTQEMIARGEWRIRRVDYDNAPQGREVHWASAFHWWLAGLAWADHVASGRPLGVSVERATLYSGPVMLALLLLGLVPFLWRRFSAEAALLVAFGAVAYFPFYLDFEAGYADHHGLANTCGLFTVLFLVAGCSQAAGEPVRRWFLASAVAGGAGLWISAATQTPVLLGIGLGVLAAGWVGRRASPQPVWMIDPGLWRLWGWAGGGCSFATYLLEYFPDHLGLRLEVNHPLYAVAWIGAGEVLRLVTIALRDGIRAVPRRELLTGLGGVALVALLPAVILGATAKTFYVADPFVWQVHTLHISEFQPLTRILGRGLDWSTVGILLPMLLLVPPLWLVLRRATPSGAKAQLVLALIPALLGGIMGWDQVRWLSLAFALSVPVFALCFRRQSSGDDVAMRRRPAVVWLIVGVLFLLPGAFRTVQMTLGATEITPDEIRNLALRDVGHWLRLRAGSDRVVLAGSPSPTTALIYYGSVTGVDTLYWENTNGLKRAAELFAAPSSDAAREIARQLGLTHIVFISWGSFEATLARLHRGLPETAPLPDDTFAATLLHSPVPPPWLRPIPYKLPAHPALEGSSVRVWEVTSAQAPAVALAGAANYFLELGMMEEAGRLAPVLARFDGDLSADVMRAAIASRQQNVGDFSAAFARIMGKLDQTGSLSLDDQVHLVVVLAVVERLDLAREQLRRCMSRLDEPGLRHLTPGTLADLVALSDALGVDFPAGDLKQLAESLLPPDKRSK